MISLKNISLKYQKSILENINIDFQDNKIVSIIGKKAVGKSTLLNIITRIAKPSSG